MSGERERETREGVPAFQPFPLTTTSTATSRPSIFCALSGVCLSLSLSLSVCVCVCVYTCACVALVA
jgi:hypothetical protein